jgi:hypothetical protein
MPSTVANSCCSRLPVAVDRPVSFVACDDWSSWIGKALIGLITTVVNFAERLTVCRLPFCLWIFENQLIFHFVSHCGLIAGFLLRAFSVTRVFCGQCDGFVERLNECKAQEQEFFDASF